MQSTVMTLAVHDLTLFLGIFVAGIIGARVASLLKLPDVVLFLLLGIALGPACLGFVNLSSGSLLNTLILLFGASFIIFHGGLMIQWRILRNVWVTISLLSVTGLLITVIITGIGASWILGIPTISGLLLGAILASTDPAALVPIFQAFPIRERVAQTVIAESAFTDATGAILTTVILGIIGVKATESVPSPTFDASTFLHASGTFFWLAGGGIAVGFAVGMVCAAMLSFRRGGIFQEYAPTVAILAVLGGYLVAEEIHVSGFMSVFTAGIVLGNSVRFKMALLHDQMKQLHDFIDPISLKMRMLIFIFLGSQVDFGLISDYGWQALAVVLVFMFIARPITVLFSLVPDRTVKWTLREMIFFCWTRETGVIAAALIGMIAGTGLKEAKLFSAVIFVVILATLLVQASTTPWLAKKLGLLEDQS